MAMIRNASRRRIALLSALLLTGCSIGPEYKKPDVAVPTGFRSQIAMTEAVSFADQPWWGVFQDKALQQLIKDALINNNDLQLAVARIQQARAQVESSTPKACRRSAINLTAAAKEALRRRHGLAPKP